MIISAGLHAQTRCPKGGKCNFLHVFRNPGSEFRNADRDVFRNTSPSTRSRSVVASLYECFDTSSNIIELVDLFAERIWTGVGLRRLSCLYVVTVDVNDVHPGRKRTGIGLRSTNPLLKKSETRALAPKRTTSIVVLPGARNVFAVVAVLRNAR